ncbi:prepilin-type N-terminal cleavage/methylation domain-containing protein [Variovorax sp. PCZ-1]|uniref:pilin n=1 Tax=Variovorax sp. PCZ-1 TaxID=2835533 RepID=UPI001BCBA221|nr:prepilin-type N-terminal cleavage/methylation domain-containing protein [Variovorax sp. PCZ-1]MBS7808491.1 prepilin-type N-terminal cleavage/methylation domain-containing protein [Variovorax sp. PCZ-1]
MSYRAKGFTLFEILISIAIVGILATVAVVGYQEYTYRARAADILLRYDAIKTGAQSRAAQQKFDNCSDLLKTFETNNLADQYATLNYGFEAVNGGGYRPVLTVCGKAEPGNPWGSRVAKGAHDTMLKTGAVEQGAVVTDAVVSFALPLSQSGQALCKIWTAPVANSSCAASPVVTASAQTAVPQAATSASSTPQATTPTAAATSVAAATQTVAAVAQVTPLAPAPMAESVKTDFSQPPIQGSWMMQDPRVWGWSTDNPDGKVEYGKGVAYGDTSGGNIGVIELEGYANTPSNLFRTISAQPGAKYLFTFDLSGRVGTSSDSAAVQVIWEGKVVDTLRPPGNVFGFVRHSYNLVATGTGSRIELRAVTQDGTGPVVDNLAMEFKGLNSGTSR